MWTYKQSTGQLFDKDFTLAGTGYSGHAEGVNNPALQSHRGIGPIPRGIFVIGAPFDSPDHGEYCLRLTPHPENEMFDRSGFLMHGDKKSMPGMFAASLGCVIQARATREKVWNSGDHAIEVIE
jgi:hypothetical protein